MSKGKGKGKTKAPKESVTDTRKATILLDRRALDFMLIAARSTDDEVGGLFTVENLGGGVLQCSDPVLLPQVVSGASVELDQTAMLEWIKKHGGCEEERMPYFLMGWWHSHNHMKSYFSTTDHEFVRDWVTRAPMVSIVVNHDGEIYSRVDTFAGHEWDTKLGFVAEIPSKLELTYSLDVNEKAKIEAEVKEKCESLGTVYSLTGATTTGDSSYISRYEEISLDDCEDHPLVDVTTDGKGWIWPNPQGELLMAETLPYYVCRHCGVGFSQHGTKHRCDKGYTSMSMDKYLDMLLTSRTSRMRGTVSMTGKNGEVVSIRNGKVTVKGKGVTMKDLTLTPKTLEMLEDVIPTDTYEAILNVLRTG